MLLAIDVGNSHTVLGIYDGAHLRHHWRLETKRSNTEDEYGVLVRLLLAAGGHPPIHAAAISSVVPPVTQVIAGFCRRYLAVVPLVVGPGVRTGMPILYDDPQQVGTDRVANAIAAYERTHTATVVVDCGTATKFEYVSARGEYIGGAIAPGLGIAADALFERTAKLTRVELTAPLQVVGRTTVSAIQSGLIYGYAALVDGMVRRIHAEQGGPTPVLATGGFASLLAPKSETIERCDEFLTLDGVRLISERNSGH